MLDLILVALAIFAVLWLMRRSPAEREADRLMRRRPRN